MTNITQPIPLNHYAIKALDVGKFQILNAYDMPEDKYNNFVKAEENALRAKYSSIENINGNSRYDEYATIQKDGEVIASVSNNGAITHYGEINQNKVKDIYSNVSGQGPDMAKLIAEKISNYVGGNIIKSSSAITQAEFMSTPKSFVKTDYLAMKNDDAYKMLQKTKEARVMVLAQEMGQANTVKTSDSNNITAESSATEEFLEYMDKTPEERLMEAILKEMGLSKEQFDAKPAEEKAELLKEIQRKMKEKLDNKILGGTG